MKGERAERGKERQSLTGRGPDGWRCVLTRWFSDFQGRWLVDCVVYDWHNRERWHQGYATVEFSEDVARRLARKVHDRLA